MWSKDASSLLSKILDFAYEYLVYTKDVTH